MIPITRLRPSSMHGRIHPSLVSRPCDGHLNHHGSDSCGVFWRLLTAEFGLSVATTLPLAQWDLNNAEHCRSFTVAHPTLTFQVWKRFLESDCEWHGKLEEFSTLEDEVLQLRWERGQEPTVQEIVVDGRRFGKSA